MSTRTFGRNSDRGRARYVALLCLALLIAACTATVAAPARRPKAGGLPLTPGTGVPAGCEVTRPPDPGFVPPALWPSQPPEDRFWYGDASLWTALPPDGSWPQLARGEKLWWWSEQFDVSEDATPDLSVTAERIDGAAPPYQAAKATIGYHESLGQAMLVGVELPSSGCWQFTGEYKGSRLSFVVWVAP